jgi:hypothetical protein
MLRKYKQSKALPAAAFSASFFVPAIEGLTHFMTKGMQLIKKTALEGTQA